MASRTSILPCPLASSRERERQLPLSYSTYPIMQLKSFTSMASEINVGDPVWAKMKGFSPWPAKVVEPSKEVKRPNLKKPMHYVFFFGSDNYAWIPDENIYPYDEHKDKYLKQSKGGAFKDAVQAIANYSRTLPKKEKPTSIENDVEKSQTNGVTLKSQPQVNNNKVVKRDQIKKVTKVRKEISASIKVGKTAGKRRLSESSSTSSSSNKKLKTVDKFTALLASTPPNAGFSSLSSIPPSQPYVNSTTTKQSGLLMRPAYVSRPVTPPLDVERLSDTLKQKSIKPSVLKFGFLGLGIMGRGIVKNLINSGHSVTVWNRTPSKCRDFVKAGAIKGQTPADVVIASDITFSCVSDPQAAKELVFGNCGVLQEIRTNKGYVEMTSVDPETSQDIAEAVIARGGRFLEAPLSGSKRPAEEGTLIILAAGDRSLFNDCSTCFQAMGKHAFYLGEVGNGSKMNLVVNMVLGTTLAALAEAMALADRTGISQKDLLEILELGPLNCSALMEKGQAIIEGTFPTNMPLQHMQKDLHLALGIGDQMEQPLPLTAAANEVYKHAKRLSYGEHDVSAVYLRARF